MLPINNIDSEYLSLQATVFVIWLEFTIASIILPYSRPTTNLLAPGEDVSGCETGRRQYLSKSITKKCSRFAAVHSTRAFTARTTVHSAQRGSV